MLKQACYDNNFACPEYWLNRYQTLIGALIALATAVWGIAALYRIEDNKWQSKRAAARAVLPLNLSALSEYAETCAPLLDELLDKCVGNSLPKVVAIPEFPTVPIEAVLGLKEMVEFSYTSERRFISALLARIQIQRSRINGMKLDHLRLGHTLTDSNLMAYISDSALIHARASALYDFARWKVEQMPSDITIEEVQSGIHGLGLFDISYDRIVTYLGGKIPRP